MDFHQIISPTQKYSFLAGAGVSFDNPSNLPVARQIVYGLLDILNIEDAHRSEFKMRFEASELRFEQFIEQIVRCYDDRQLNFFNNLANCKSPNRNHHFLASALVAGHHVFTTNFDTLIEQAGQDISFLVESIYDDESVKSRKDKAKYPLYKLHGTILDESGNDRRSSVVALISSMGKIGEGLSLAPNFKLLLDETFQKSPLIVMGYSGSDDYDILPALAQVNDPTQLIWIHHSDNKDNIELYDSYTWDMLPDSLSKILNDLVSFGSWKRKNITVVIGNTSIILDEIAKILISQQKDYISKEKYETPDYFYEDWKYEYALEEWRDKEFIAQIYESLGQYHKAIPYLQEALKRVEVISDRSAQLHLHTGIAAIYLRLRIPKVAKEHLDKIAELSQEVQLTSFYENLLNEYHAIYYSEIGDYQKAEKLLKNKMPNKTESIYSGYIFELSRIKEKMGDRENARVLVEEALELNRKNGKLNSVVHCLNYLVDAYMRWEDYRLALDNVLESIRICNLTNNFSLLAECYEKRSKLYRKLGLVGRAFQDLLSALNMYQSRVQNVRGEALCCARISSVLYKIEEMKSKFSLNATEKIKGYYLESWGYIFAPSEMPPAMLNIFSGLVDGGLVLHGKTSLELEQDFHGYFLDTNKPSIPRNISHGLVIEDIFPTDTASSKEYAIRAMRIAKDVNLKELETDVFELLPLEIKESLSS